ncbi:MAG: hypothetical protein HY927_11255, partial [Elusimicrobia bacterium]|nr:hypothetical protein [Elusimicrobiota bacterium]
MRPERGKYGLLGPGSLLPSLGLLLAASGFLTPVVNPDLYWHLSAGRLMAETLSVPRADWLSHTLP